jgi:DNA polymerase III alpha subunit
MKFPLANYTHYSLGTAFSKPKDLIDYCVKYNLPACGISDYKSVSGAVDFYKHAKSAGIKPIIGCSLDDCRLYAKNHRGWVDLVHVVSSIDKNGNYDQNFVNDIVSQNNLIKRSLNEDRDSYYINESDKVLHSILLCSKLKTTLSSKEATEELLKYENKHLFIEDKNMSEIYDSVEDIGILNPPTLPTYPTPNKETEEEYLKNLCRIGWEKFLKQKTRNSKDKQVYLDRFLKEFEVIKEANLFGYFLIVQDIIKFTNGNGWMTGPGRGSAAGCLISYLLGITQIDPIEYDLIFERFYNKGRNSKDHISLPDIDIDVPALKREPIIQYIKNKYGINYVGQIATFGRLQGRSAIKEVFRVKEACSFTEVNEITKHIPDEAKISDQLEEMDEEDRSIIMWSLLNNTNDLKDFCFINSSGELEGDFAEHFKHAIAIEGTFKTQGKHAAGVVVSGRKLQDVCPMINPKEGEEKICGFEMEDLESVGLPKLDVLGLSLLDKLMYIKEI